MFVADYNKLEMHRIMLRDQIRCKAFKEAILETVSRGDVVLDVGAGTGILSLFAAQAGASKVYAVEVSDVAKLAESVVVSNQAEAVVEVIHADIEKARLTSKVDVLISEWMGVFGVDENFLHPVLHARDRWLRPSGEIIPKLVKSWMAPVYRESIDLDLSFWRSCPYDVDLSPIADLTCQEALTGPSLSANMLIAKPQELWTVDPRGAPIGRASQPFRADLAFTVNRNSTFSGLAAWFTAQLSDSVKISTAPGQPETHWGHMLFPLFAPREVFPGTLIETSFQCKPAGPGFSHMSWRIRIDHREWENHSTIHNITLPASAGGRESW